MLALNADGSISKIFKASPKRFGEKGANIFMLNELLPEGTTPKTMLLPNDLIHTFFRDYPDRLLSHTTEPSSPMQHKQRIKNQFFAWISKNRAMVATIDDIFREKKVVVRSSGNEDMEAQTHAGCYDSVLDVPTERVLDALSEVFSSYFIPNYPINEIEGQPFQKAYGERDGAFIIQEMIGSQNVRDLQGHIPILAPAILMRMAIMTKHISDNGFNGKPVDMEWVLTSGDCTVSAISFSHDPNGRSNVVIINCAIGAGSIVKGDNPFISTYYVNPTNPQHLTISAQQYCPFHFFGRVPIQLFAVQARLATINPVIHQDYIDQKLDHRYKVIEAEMIVNIGQIKKGHALVSLNLNSAWMAFSSRTVEEKSTCACVVVLNGAALDHYAILFREQSLNVYRVSVTDYTWLQLHENSLLTADPQSFRIIISKNKTALNRLVAVKGLQISKNNFSDELIHILDNLQKPITQPMVTDVAVSAGLLEKALLTHHILTQHFSVLINKLKNAIMKNELEHPFHIDIHNIRTQLDALSHDLTQVSDSYSKDIHCCVGLIDTIVSSMDKSIDAMDFLTALYYCEIFGQYLKEILLPREYPLDMPKGFGVATPTKSLLTILHEVAHCFLRKNGYRILLNSLVTPHIKKYLKKEPELFHVIKIQACINSNDCVAQSKLPHAQLYQEFLSTCANANTENLFQYNTIFKLNKAWNMICERDYLEGGHNPLLHLIQKQRPASVMDVEHIFDLMISLYSDTFFRADFSYLGQLLANESIINSLQIFKDEPGALTYLIQTIGSSQTLELLDLIGKESNQALRNIVLAVIIEMNRGKGMREYVLDRLKGEDQAWGMVGERLALELMAPLLRLCPLRGTMSRTENLNPINILVCNVIDTIVELFDNIGKLFCLDLSKNQCTVFDVYIDHLVKWFSNIKLIYANEYSNDKTIFFKFIDVQLSRVKAEHKIDIGLTEVSWLCAITRFPDNPINIHQLHNTIHQSELNLRAQLFEFCIPKESIVLRRLMNIANRFSFLPNRVLRVAGNFIDLDLALSQHRSLARFTPEYSSFEFIELPSKRMILDHKLARLHSFVLWLHIIFDNSPYTWNHQFCNNIYDFTIIIRVFKEKDKMTAEDTIEVFDNIKTLFDCSHWFARCPTKMIRQLSNCKKSQTLKKLFHMIKGYCNQIDYTTCRRRASRNFCSHFFTYASIQPMLFCRIYRVSERGYESFLSYCLKKIKQDKPFKQNYFRHWKTMDLKKVLLVYLSICVLASHNNCIKTT